MGQTRRMLISEVPLVREKMQSGFRYGGPSVCDLHTVCCRYLERNERKRNSPIKNLQSAVTRFSSLPFSRRECIRGDYFQVSVSFSVGSLVETFKFYLSALTTKPNQMWNPLLVKQLEISFRSGFPFLVPRIPLRRSLFFFSSFVTNRYLSPFFDGSSLRKKMYKFRVLPTAANFLFHIPFHYVTLTWP